MSTSDQRTFHRLDKARARAKAGEHFRDSPFVLAPGVANILASLGLDGEQPPESAAAWQAFLQKVHQAYTAKGHPSLPNSASLTARHAKFEEVFGPVSLGDAVTEGDTLHAVIQAMGLGVCTLDVKGRVRSINPAGQRLLEYTEADLLGVVFFDRVVGDCASGTVRNGMPNRAEVLTSGRNGYEKESQFTRKDGTVLPVFYTLNPIAEKDGQQGHVLTFIDLTEQRRAHETLRASEERHRTLTEYAAEAIVVLDVKTGHFMDSNTKAEVLFGLSSDELRHTGPAERSPMYQPDGRRSVEAFQEEMAQVLRGDVRVFEWSCLHATGRMIPCEVRLVRMPSADQWLVRGSITDITERKRAEEVLIQAREEAEEMSHLKTAFLNNMSHEIRTPLTAIIGFSTILADDITSEHKELIELIGQSGKRLLNTLNAVLDLSMLEAGTFTPENEWFDIVETAEEKVAEMQLLAREKRIELDLITSQPNIPVYLDRTCLDRILTHLIDNAIKFTEQGRVTVLVEAGKRRVDIRVDDTGVGIGVAFQPYLFDEFKQESTGLDRDHTGIGLGLAVTSRMVTLMGGEIAVTSQKGAGSSFMLTFTQPGQHGRSALAGHFNFLNDTRPKPRILVVEDTPEIELLIEHMLGDVYEVVLTSDEAGALSLVQQQSFDLVLMDINLGSARTGVDVMETFRQLPGGANLPIVAMTAYALLEDRVRFLEAGFDGYLSKPFSVQQAYEVIEPLLNV